MKKILTLIIIVLCAATLFAQAPEKFSYQAVVRNASNALVTNAQVSVRVSVLQGDANGNAVYVETHTATTNTNGLLTIEIGGGTVQQGVFANVDWANGPFFLKTETDPNGGSDYSVTSTQQLLSVPYALYAKDAGNVPTVPANVSAFTNDAGYITAQDIPEIPTVPTNVSAFVNDVPYMTSFTEQQILTISNDTIFLTGGSFVKLPEGFNGDYNNLTNTPDIPTVPTNVSAFVNDMGYLTSFTEQQVLSISNDTIFLTGGSFVKLPAGFDGDYNSLTNTPAIPTVPTDVSVFNNDANYVSNTECADVDLCALAALVSSLQGQLEELQGQLAEMQSTIDSLTIPDTTVTPVATLPTVITSAVSDITETTATCGGEVTADGGATVTERGVCWSTSATPTVADTHTSDGTGLGTFTSNITGLTTGTTYYVRAYATNSVGTAYGETVSFTTSDSVPNPVVHGQPCPGTPTVTDYDGNVYNTVQIGNQCWIKENLRTTHYENGTEIIAGEENYSYIDPYYYDYTSSSIPLEERGYHYNWAAVMHGASTSESNPSGVQGICPMGWHVPSDAEWTQMTDFVSSQSMYVCGNDNTYIAKALSSNSGWNTYIYIDSCDVGNEQSHNNATGFSAFPAGVSCYGNVESGIGYDACFWSSTEENSDLAWRRSLYYSNSDVALGSDHKRNGYSVRCLRDSAVVVVDTTAENIPVVDEKSCSGTPTVTDHEGNVYATVQIGNQCWMRENLRTTTSPSTGTYLIPAADAGYTYTGKQARWYDNDSATYAPMNYGLLYNWNAAVDTFNTEYGEISVNSTYVYAVLVSFTDPRRGICPAGWHLPSDEEWNTMEATVCGLDWETSYATYTGGRGYHAGKLAGGDGWYNSNTIWTDAPGNYSNIDRNVSGFSAFPAGSGGSLFNGVGSSAYFWTSTERSSRYAYIRHISYDEAEVDRDYRFKYVGFSVRCLRD